VLGVWDQHSYRLYVEVEIRWHGRQRGADSASRGRREPSPEAAGRGPEPAPGSTEGGDPKNRVELAGLREDIAFALTSFRVSECAACKLLSVDRSSYRYEAKSDHNVELRVELVKLARQKPRFGYRDLYAVLERRGYEVNVKRIYRLYMKEGLPVRRRRRKRLVRERAAEPRLTRASQERGIDFIVDGLASGRMISILSVVDACPSSAWRWTQIPTRPAAP